MLLAVGIAAGVTAPTVGLPPAQLAATSLENRHFVTAAFIDMLGREPSPPVASYFTGGLDAGGSRADVITFLLGTIEYRAVVVDRFYRDYLLRPADPGGEAFYTNQLRNGVSQLQVKVQIIGSDEYKTAHSGTNSGFINGLYLDALGRAADPAGLAYWIGQVNSGVITRPALTDLFLHLPESRDAVVTRFFLELLNRAPDPGGLAYFSGLLQAGAPLSQVITELTTSDEYFGLAQTQVGPQPPQAVNDTATTTTGTAVIVHVTANDTDADGDLNPSSVAVVGTGPAHGSASQSQPGYITYTPTAGYNGGDFFFYRVCDTTAGFPLCDTARVRIVITSADQRPDAVDDSAPTNEDTAVAVSVTLNDTDPNGNQDPSSVTVLTQPTHGTAQPSNGVVTYTPAPNYFGPDAFTYRLCDTTALCDSATVTITVTAVNDAPVANDDSYSVAASTPLTVDAATGLIANDTDIEGDTLTATMATSTDCDPDMILNPDGSFTFSAPATPGDCTFTYFANDGTDNSNTATVTITVT